jgi:hypothetical protein
MILIKNIYSPLKKNEQEKIVLIEKIHFLI